MSVNDYLANVSDDKKDAFQLLHQTILENVPKGFEEGMSYKMIGYYVPHSRYPAGYHCDPKLPLPFINIAAQKNFIALYHMGLYADKKMYDWFVNEYPKHTNVKLDMGKSCIRFKKWNQIPFHLIGELVSKMTPTEWIKVYETQFQK